VIYEFRSTVPFEKGWTAPPYYNSSRLFYDQPAFADFCTFVGFKYLDPDYSFWKDDHAFSLVNAQIGDFGPLLKALGVRNMLSLGSSRPVWEVLLCAQAPGVRLVASDINVPNNVQKDLLEGAEHGFPAAASISYLKLDIRDSATIEQVLREHSIDTIFICSCFFVVPDKDWDRLLKVARKNGVKHVILLHTEAISPLNLIRCRLVKPNEKGVLMGWYRSASAVLNLFSRAGYQCLARYVPLRSTNFMRRALGFLRVHYAHRGYIFSTDRPAGSLRALLKRATTAKYFPANSFDDGRMGCPHANP
jgi:hypothetical protein